MTLTDDTAPTPLDTIEADSPRPTAKRRKIVTAAAAIFVAGTIAGVAIVETSGPASPDRTTQPAAQSREDLVRKLVNGGVVPAATLESAPPPSREDLVRKLVNGGVVPAATLESAPRPSREDLVRKLVNSGVVPAATLEPAPPSREDLIRELVARGLIPAATLD